MFHKIYFFISLVLWLIALPFLYILQFYKKYHKSIPARFWLRNNKLKLKDGGIWFHACSLGEVNSLKPFISKISENKNIDILLTTITETGFNSANNLKIQLNFLPFEPLLYFLKINSSKLIVFEAELWFMLFANQKQKGSKTILLSGRITSRSFPKYLRFKFLYSQIFKNIDLILAQSIEDKNRFLELGAKNIEIIGNVKLLKSKNNNSLDIKKDKIIIVGASTHKGDEQIILNAFKNLGWGKLLIVPRHKERFDEVWQLIETYKQWGFITNRYSINNNFEGDIILIDKFGLLIDIYSKSDVVILGGAFVDGIGGHNPVEPASFNNKIISGNYMFNQKELLKYIKNIKFINKNELENILKNIYLVENAEITENIDFELILKKLE
jgi:3-deoxy-D-manno-octulosonic-acid transferase